MSFDVTSPYKYYYYMEIQGYFDHFNFNVTDLSRSLTFYREALGFVPVGEIDGPEGQFKIVYLGDGHSSFRLELTWLRDHPQEYNLGECEFHLCVRVEGNYAAVRERHREMGCLCYENLEMGLYFIQDPDGYWIEILPAENQVNK